MTALVRLAEPIALTSVFPYAWKLILHFDVTNENNAAFYAGIFISSFALAEALTGMYWGGLSDRIGRKPVLLLGCFGTFISLLMVGLAHNFWVALLGRALGGFLNGNIGVIQTMVGELVHKPEHEPKAYAVMPFIWSVGTIIGRMFTCFSFMMTSESLMPEQPPLEDTLQSQRWLFLHGSLQQVYLVNFHFSFRI